MKTEQNANITDVDVCNLRVTRTATNERFWLEVMQFTENSHDRCFQFLNNLLFD